MNTPKWPLLAALSLATAFVVACGDPPPSNSLTKEEVICAKEAKYVAKPNCSAGGTTPATTTAATPSTVTVTSSTTQ